MALSLLGCLPPSAKCQVPISAKKLLRFSPFLGLAVAKVRSD